MTASPDPDLRSFVQHRAPTLRKTKHENLAHLVEALVLLQPRLCLPDVARA